MKLIRASLLVVCSLWVGCGSSPKPITATGLWNVDLVSAVPSGQEPSLASLQLTITQKTNTLEGSVTAVVQQSSCFPPVSANGSTLRGQVKLPGGEAMENLDVSVLLPASNASDTLNLKGSMQADANSAAGTYMLTDLPAGCSSATGTFTMKRLPAL
jgi:hypothetical protein